MFCSRCGYQLGEDALFCERCGTPAALVSARAPAEDPSPKSRLATTLLAVFLGWVGAHRFYTGRTRSAAVMLLLGVVAWGCYMTYIVGFMMSTWDTAGEGSDRASFWLLFFLAAGVLGLPVGIWALVDFIMAVTGNFRDREGRPIRKW